MPSQSVARFWVLGQEMLRELLERARAGEDIDLLLVELYANSEIEPVEGDV